jgi:hypothetical protein
MTNAQYRHHRFSYTTSFAKVQAMFLVEVGGKGGYVLRIGRKGSQMACIRLTIAG